MTREEIKLSRLRLKEIQRKKEGWCVNNSVQKWGGGGGGGITGREEGGGQCLKKDDNEREKETKRNQVVI